VRVRKHTNIVRVRQHSQILCVYGNTNIVRVRQHSQILCVYGNTQILCVYGNTHKYCSCTETHKYCACTATLTNTLRVRQHTDTNNIKFFLLPTLMTSNKNFIEIHSVVLRPTDRISSKCVVHCVQFMDRTQNVPRTEDTPLQFVGRTQNVPRTEDTPRLQFVDRTQNVRRTEDTPQLQFRVVVLPDPIHPLTRINSQQLTG
jgi:hypothetical protein